MSSGELLPFLKINFFMLKPFWTPAFWWKGSVECSPILSACFYVFFLFIMCFRSLFINTRLVFISYFAPAPSQKRSCGLRMYVLVTVSSAFLIIYIETLVFVDCFVIIATFPIFSLRSKFGNEIILSLVQETFSER